MFTGIIEEVGVVRDARPFGGGARLTIAAGFAGAVKPGDSIAVNGVCLTAESGQWPVGTFGVAAVEETLRRTTAGSWRSGTRVHLERALKASGRFDGHIVQGHVDGPGHVLRAGPEGSEFVLTLQMGSALRKYVVEKGSLAVDGVSLTVGKLRGGHCRLFIVPETLARTCIGQYRAGERVNVEVDIVAKYVESLHAKR